MSPSKRFKSSATLLLALLLACGAWAQPVSPLQRAHEAIDTHLRESAAREAAIAQGLYNDADARDAAARTALLDAKAALDGVPVATLGLADMLDYAEVLRRLGYDDLVGEMLEQAVVAQPGEASLWALLGAAKIRCGPKHEPRGLEALRKALALDAGQVVALTALGEFYNAQGLYDLAQEALEKAVAPLAALPGPEGRKFAAAVEAGKPLPEAVVRLAALQVRSGKIVEANAALDALGQAGRPFDALTRVLLREALARFEDDGRFFDDVAANHVAYAKLMYRAGRLSEAILAGSRATRLDPKDTKTLNFIGSIYLQLGSLDAALQAYEKSLAADADQPDVAKVLEQIKAELAKRPAAPAEAPAPAPVAP